MGQIDLFNGKIVDSNVVIKDKKERCKYCGDLFKSVDNRHLATCKKYIELKDKYKDKKITDYFQISGAFYPIEQIYPNSWNVNSMSQEEFESLKESIQRTKGAFLKDNPIQIREIEKDKYEIIDGGRAKILNLHTFLQLLKRILMSEKLKQ